MTTINLNKITLSQLKALFPELSEDQLSDFFKYRDGSPEEKMEPNPFNSEEDFKNYLIKELSAVDESTYKERKKVLKKAKVSFGVAGNLFRCISEGKFGKSTYKLESFINIPLEEPSEREILNYKRQLKRWKNATNPSFWLKDGTVPSFGPFSDLGACKTISFVPFGPNRV